MRKFLFLCTLLFTVLSFTWVNASSQYIVDTERIYSSRNFYGDVKTTLQNLNKRYSGFTELAVIGKTVEKRDILAFKIGKGKKEILINGTHHALEYMGTVLILNQIENLAKAYEGNYIIYGYDAHSLLDEVSIWFVPTVNPDGVELCKRGLPAVSNKDYVLSIAQVKKAFKSWKANVRGVDLNKNYDINRGWMENAAKRPGSMNYPGNKAFSEPETAAIRDFCRKHQFETALAYHSAGEIIYWSYFLSPRDHEERDYRIAKGLSNLTGYDLVRKETRINNGGNFKDWFTSTYKKPAFTLEIGTGAISTPLNYSGYNRIWRENAKVPLYLVNLVSNNLNAVKPSRPEFDIDSKTRDVTDNVKKPLTVNSLPYTVSLDNNTNFAVSWSWYVWEEGNGWVFFSKERDEKYQIRKTGEVTFKLQCNNDPSCFMVHNVVSEMHKIRTTLDGRQLELEQSPLIVDNKLYLPLGPLLNEFGASVKWNETDHTIEIVKDDLDMKAEVGSKNVWVNGNIEKLQTPVFTNEERNYMESEFIARHMNKSIVWDAQFRVVVITSK